MLGTDIPMLHEALEIIHSPTISEGSRVGGGVHGVCLTVTLHSLDLGGLWVAEQSTYPRPESPLLPSLTEGTQSRHCEENSYPFKQKPH